MLTRVLRGRAETRRLLDAMHGTRLLSDARHAQWRGRQPRTDAELTFAQRYGPGTKASAFTGRPSFYEALFFMTDVLERARAVAPTPRSVALPWLPAEQMSARVGFALGPLEYRKLRDVLGQIAQHAHAAPVRDFVSAFTPATPSELDAAYSGEVSAPSAPSTPSAQQPVGERESLVLKYSSREPREATRLADGRTVAEGRRKTAVATATLVRGTGECLVNGRPAAVHFPRAAEMLRLADPLAVAGMLGRVNAWLVVRGGGPSGQAGAAAHAIAKAAAAMRPECRDALVRAGGLLYSDPRCRERKKPGQPGARKRFTWVKR